MRSESFTNLDMPIVGYCDRPSVAPGERIRFYVSREEPGTYRAELVRLIHGDTNPDGPGYRDERVPSPIDGEHRGALQEARAGSYVRVSDRGELSGERGFTLQAMIMPTTPEKGLQGIMARWTGERGAGYGLLVDERGCLAVFVGDGGAQRVELSSGTPMLAGCWYLAAASLDVEAGVLSVLQEPVQTSSNGRSGPTPATERSAASRSVSTAVRPPAGGDVPFTMAAFVASAGGGPRPRTAGHFNGKIDRPRVSRGALPRERIVAFVEQPRGRDVLAAWDFGHDIGRHGIAAVSRAHDVSPNGLHGEVVNLPARAMTGWNWRGDEYDCRHAPEQYGAIHFHDDDLGDAGWDVSLELTVPGDLRSGVYAIHLETDGGEDYVPFFVRPPRGTATAPIALLIPTNSYLAYANDHLALNAELVQLVAGQVPTLKASDVYRNRHREIGASCYDTHSDGSGVCYSTWARPLLNVRPKYENAMGRLWQFNADLHLVDWLVARGYEFDVLTDQDLHLEGAPLLRPYRVVLTGSHPEYWSGRMLDAMEAYQDAGGRFMYLGGNGMYWVTSLSPEDPNVIEVRRWGGTEAWTAQPGEYHHSFTGEMGGLWRARGRPPQKIAGVGFVAQGMDASTYYRRNADSFRPEVAWIFEGVGDDELIGAFGLSGGGAAGLEIDWYDEATGSPQDAYLLASSEGHTDNMLEVRENFGMTIPALGGAQDPRVRADLVYYDTRNGGAVFSTGSIAWCGSLSHNGYDNNVSRIMANVLDRFAAADGAANGRARRIGETVESDVHGGA